MSYSIYYDRAFIRVGDKVIPLANSGSNNCWEFLNRREVPEKNWNVMNWQRDNQFLFTESELREVARIYDQYNQSSGMIYKSRSYCFKQGELESWIMNGMIRAYTIEEYVSFGNSFYVLGYSSDEISDWKRYPFHTTDEMLKILEELKDVKQKDIKIRNNREVFRPVVQRAPRKNLNSAELTEYFVLKAFYNGQTVFFMKLLKRSIEFVYRLNDGARIFKTDKEARKYLAKYKSRLSNDRILFVPERIVND